MEKSLEVPWHATKTSQTVTARTSCTVSTTLRCIPIQLILNLAISDLVIFEYVI